MNVLFLSQLSFMLSSVCCLISPQFVNAVVGKDASAPSGHRGWSGSVFSDHGEKLFPGEALSRETQLLCWPSPRT